ncbi:MAG: V-type ATPase subunit [Desulfurococcales archaeon]|nr:V-type ATPase subunit [Desulfurococcales archaeon]
MTASDLKFIEMVKARIHRCLLPSALPKITSTNLSDLGSFITFLISYDVSKCIQTYIKLDERVGINSIFSALSNCWMDELKKIIRLAHPSQKLKQFIEMYLSKFEISELINALRERDFIDKKHYYFLKPEVLSRISYARSVSDLINVLKEVRRPYTRLFIDVLSKFSNLGLSELDVGTVERMVYERYWRELSEISRKLHPSHKLASSLRIIQLTSKLEKEVRRAVVNKEDISSVLRKVPAVVSNAIAAAQGSTQELDIVFNVIRYMYCINELTFSPLSYDVVLNYLLVKEWESFLISFVTYLITQGFDKEYILERLSRWWKVYEYLTKS